MIRSITPAAVGLGALLSLSACNNPYDPGQRALGGALIGAAVGAGLGAATTPSYVAPAPAYHEGPRYYSPRRGYYHGRGYDR